MQTTDEFLADLNRYGVPFVVEDSFGRSMIVPPAAWHAVFGSLPLANGKPARTGGVSQTVLTQMQKDFNRA